MNNKIVKFISLWLPVLLWALVIFKLSSGNVPLTSENYWQDFAVKKLAHVLFFGFFALLFYRGLVGQGVKRRDAAIYSIIVTILYGITDEYHQTYTSGRQPHIRDVGFDGVGAAIVIYFIYNYISILPEKVRIFLLKLGIK